MARFGNHPQHVSVSHRRATRILRCDRGIALISVLWVLVLLTAIVGEFAYSMRTEVNITRNFKDATQAYYIAHSGLMRAVLEMSSNTTGTKNQESADGVAPDTVWRINVPIPPEKFGSGEFSVHIDNSGGLIDLNTASENLLRLMVSRLDIDDREKDVIVDSILDWRDSDNFHRLNGAENKYYQSLPDPYACKNAAFDSVEELILVRGVSPELFHKQLKSIITIIPQHQATLNATDRSSTGPATAKIGQININAAPRRLLEALPQITPQDVQILIDYRMDRDFISIGEIRDLLGDQTLSAILPYITLSLSPYYTIRAEGRVSGSSVRQNIQAMVQIEEGLTGGYQIVGWRDQYY